MSIQAGLVGLPNVGKSTLFNALTKSQIPAENYPFCTIDPHMAITEVPDERLDQLQKIYGSQKKIPASVHFIDIAGLVKGAASGEGLGNQFLSHIREVDLILHVLRCFEDPNIMHHGDTIDPLEDYHIIVSELMLKDLESVQKRLDRIPKLLRGATQAQERKSLEAEQSLLTSLRNALDEADSQEVRRLMQASPIQTIPLLSAKNFLIIANIGEDQIDDPEQNEYYQTLAKEFGKERVIAVCAKIEHELSQLNDQEAQEMLSMLGMKEKSLDKIIRESYANLGLITFFTCGPKEVHAWPIKKGMTVRQAAGEIHSDLQRGFICADVYNYTALFDAGSVQKIKDTGMSRTEGQDYIVQNGDIINVKFNV